MRRSHTITIAIERPVADVYAYLSEPRRFPDWTTFDPHGFHKVSDWLWEGRWQGKTRRVQFTPSNSFGVLDHGVFTEGEVPLMMPMRVVANGAGTELIYTFLQRDGMTDEQLASTIEWITADFWSLKSMLEV